MAGRKNNKNHNNKKKAQAKARAKARAKAGAKVGVENVFLVKTHRNRCALRIMKVI